MSVSITIPESYIQVFPVQERDSLRRLLSTIEDAVNAGILQISLDDLSDVVAPSPVLGDSIFFDGTDWVSDSPLTQIVSSSTTPYIASLTDNGKFIVLTSGSSMTFEIPPQSSVTWPDGAQFEIVQGGTGQVTVQGGSGVTVSVNSSLTSSTFGQHAVIGVKRTGVDTWVLFGNLALA